MSNGDGADPLGNVNGIWRALLDFATRVGSTDLVNQTPSTFNMMTEQDRQFLANAMAQFMKESDPIRQLKENLDILSKLEYRAPNDEQKTQGVTALEHIIDLCGSLDIATDFHKLGGFRILVPLLASGASEFRAHAAELVGELAQNHAYCQKALHKANVLGVLLQLVDSDPDPAVRAKALFAVSCLIRNNEELHAQFVQMDGLSILLRATMSDYERLSTKASFLLSSILKRPENKEKAIEIGMINQFATMLRRRAQSHASEQTVAALLALVEDCPKAIEACRKPELDLKRLLEDRLKDIGSDSSQDDAHMQDAWIMSGPNQEKEHQRILEEIQQRKRQLMMKNTGTGAGVGAPASTFRSGAQQSKDHFAAVEPSAMTAPQKQAWQMAQNSSYASFIVQDSSFGNILLPVVPRVTPGSASGSSTSTDIGQAKKEIDVKME